VPRCGELLWNVVSSSVNFFVADRAYTTGSFGYIGGNARTFSNPIAGTNDDPLYQDLRQVRNGSFFYRFDVSAADNYDVTLYLMAPELSGSGKIIMDVLAEGAIVFDNLDVKADRHIVADEEDELGALK